MKCSELYSQMDRAKLNEVAVQMAEEIERLEQELAALREKQEGGKQNNG